MSKAQVGLAVGAINLGIAFTAILFGKLTDLFGEKKILVTGGVMAGLSIMIASQSPSFGVLLGLLLLTGLWSASSTPAGSKAIMTWFPYSMRGFAIGVRQTGVASGGFLAALILPVVAIHSNWRWSLIFAGAISIVTALVCMLLYRESKQPSPDAPIKHPKPAKIKTMLRNKSILWASIGATAFVGAQFIIIGYIQLFLQSRLSLPVAITAYFLAIAQLSGVAGRILWGVISDRYWAGARKPVMMIIGMIIALMSLSMLLIRPGVPLWLVAVDIAVFGFSAIGWNGIWIALLSELVDKDHSGTAVGMGMTVLQIGVLIFPFLFGWLIDWFGSYAVSWIGLFILMCLSLLIISRVRETRN